MKVIQKSKVESREVYQTLMKQELEVLERINHPNVVRVLDLFEDDDSIYVALELLHDGNLLELLNEISSKKLSFNERNAAYLIW